MMVAMVAMSLGAGLGAAGEAPRPVRWGVTGHPYVQESYRDVPVTAQLDLVKALGAGWYRSDWSEAALDRDPAPHDTLVAEARRRGITVLPIIFPTVSCHDDVPPERIRQASFAFARRIAARFRGRIDYWELSNELDSFAMIHKGEKDRAGQEWQWGDPAGDRPEHYQEVRYRRVEAELRGLSEGIKAGNPRATTIICTGGWLHTGFTDRLIHEDHVPFDVLSWHWYSDMGDITKVQGTVDVLSRLRAYGKPLWVTELGRRGGSMGGQEDQQAAYLRSEAARFAGYSGVEAVFAYELLDEPYFGPDNAESHYGLVEVAKGADGRWAIGRRKPAFAAFAEAIRAAGGARR